MVTPLIYIGHPHLYEKAKEIPIKEINNAKYQSFFNDLTDTIQSIDIAAGLAAPQIDRAFRVFAIRLGEKSLTYAQKFPKEPVIKPNTPFLFVNPKLQFPDNTSAIKPEACLSIPHYYGLVERPTTVTVHAFTREGIQFEITASKFLARVIQHEFDHLDGILWTQRVKSPKDIIFNGPDEADEEEN